MAKRYTMNGFICPLDDVGYPQTVVPYGGVIYLAADYYALADELATMTEGDPSWRKLREAGARIRALEAALREARKWIGDGEFSDGLDRGHWTPEYAAVVDLVDRALPQTETKGDAIDQG